MSLMLRSTRTEISMNQSNQIKGLAIIAIVLHNFIRPIIGCQCNEMSWVEINATNFLIGIKSWISPLYIIGFLGWYGVPLFILVSGYGLSIKYDKKIEFNAGRKFLFKQWKKLVILMMPTLLVFAFIVSVIYRRYYPAELLWQIPTMTANMLSFRILPGPYWFFGMIFQKYAIFLIISKLKIGTIRLLLIFAGIFIVFDYFVLYGVAPDTMVWIRHNSIGWIPVFLLGMLAARIDITVPKPIAFIGLALFSVMSVVKWFHPLNGLLLVVCVVTLCKAFESKSLVLMGLLSAYLFVLHGLTREIFYLSCWNWNLFVLITVYFAVTLTASYGYMRLDKFITRKNN